MRRARRFYETALMQLERGFNGLSRIQLGESLLLFLKAKNC
ncbi:MAG: hypothetical protein QXF77_10710 [Candidatus Jordarchaeales archaeon]